MPDSVSKVCGLEDGYSHCPHTVTFTDSNDNPINFPYNGFSWDASEFILTLNPAQALQYDSLKAIIGLVDHPSVTRTQVIESTFTTAPSIPAAPTTVNSGTNVTINWATPSSNGGSTITSYTVQI